jgi:hypothetical protein
MASKEYYYRDFIKTYVDSDGCTCFVYDHYINGEKFTEIIKVFPSDNITNKPRLSLYAT